MMNKRNPAWRLCCAILTGLLVALSTVVAPTARVSAEPQSLAGPRAPQQKETIIFAVSGEESEPDARQYSMDALVVVRNGKFLPPIDFENKEAQRSLADKFYQAGQKYRLLFGGGEAGEAVVQSWQEGCNNIHARVKLETAANLRGRISGLATNSESLGRKTSSRRALTSAERAGVMSLVNSIYRQHKTSPALMRRLNVNNLTATDLDGDGQFEFIGDFVIQTGDISGARRDLFLIARAQGKGYRAELAEFQSYRMDSGFGHGFGFLDQLDIDGDGTSEVFTLDEGFDGYGYSIYRKRNGRWRSVYSVGGDAC